MTPTEVMEQMQQLGDPARVAFHAKREATAPTFGVKNGDLRKLAKSIGNDPDLAKQLWAEHHIDAQMLAILLITQATDGR